MSEITVLANASAKKGSEAQLEATVRAAIAPTHKETGCLKYSFNRCVEDPSAFVMIEKWASREALEQHLKSPHIQELFKQLPDLLASPMEIRTFDTIREGNPEKGII